MRRAPGKPLANPRSLRVSPCPGGAAGLKLRCAFLPLGRDGAGSLLSNDPAPLRVPALHASGAGRGISRAIGAPAHRAVGSGDHRTSV